jgi:hypothetical protein
VDGARGGGSWGATPPFHTDTVGCFQFAEPENLTGPGDLTVPPPHPMQVTSDPKSPTTSRIKDALLDITYSMAQVYDIRLVGR